LQVFNDHTICTWIRQDPWRWQVLLCAEKLNLPDWCLAAGFVRNLVWDKLHNYAHSTPLTDIDLIYFNPRDLNENTEREYVSRLCAMMEAPWSVKNQARMHLRNDHEPYQSTEDAMTYWVEVETAIGVRRVNRELQLLAPLGIESLARGELTLNPRSRAENFYQRINQKQWLTKWPQLKTTAELSNQSPMLF